MFENEDVIISVGSYCIFINSTTTSIMQNSTSLAIEQIDKIYNALTHNKKDSLKHIKTKRIQLQVPITKNK